jgi:hypothetical protein
MEVVNSSGFAMLFYGIGMLGGDFGRMAEIK